MKKEKIFSSEYDHLIDFCIAISMFWQQEINELEDCTYDEISNRAKEEYFKFMESSYNYIDDYINGTKPTFIL